jgi:hypothetical protein
LDDPGVVAEVVRLGGVEPDTGDVVDDDAEQ